MPHLADSVGDTTTSTGTGAITLAGSPPVGYQSFATAFASVAVNNVPVRIDDGVGNWEISWCDFNGTTGLTRTKLRSSSTGAFVNFGAGSKTVNVVAPSELLDNGNTGMQYAAMRGLLMP